MSCVALIIEDWTLDPRSQIDRSCNLRGFFLHGGLVVFFCLGSLQDSARTSYCWSPRRDSRKQSCCSSFEFQKSLTDWDYKLSTIDHRNIWPLSIADQRDWGVHWCITCHHPARGHQRSAWNMIVFSANSRNHWYDFHADMRGNLTDCAHDGTTVLALLERLR